MPPRVIRVKVGEQYQVDLLGAIPGQPEIGLPALPRVGPPQCPPGARVDENELGSGVDQESRHRAANVFPDPQGPFGRAI